MKRHSTDLFSLLFGLLFIGLAVWWLVLRTLHLTVHVPNVGWLAAIVLIALGLLGIAGSLRRHPTDADQPAPAAAVAQPVWSAPASTPTSTAYVPVVPVAPDVTDITDGSDVPDVTDGPGVPGGSERPNVAEVPDEPGDTESEPPTGTATTT